MFPKGACARVTHLRVQYPGLDCTQSSIKARSPMNAVLSPQEYREPREPRSNLRARGRHTHGIGVTVLLALRTLRADPPSVPFGVASAPPSSPDRTVSPGSSLPFFPSPRRSDRWRGSGATGFQVSPMTTIGIAPTAANHAITSRREVLGEEVASSTSEKHGGSWFRIAMYLQRSESSASLTSPRGLHQTRLTQR